jgi:ATP-dependent exoDNAse (exonuclease V) beta subunit
VEENFDVVNMMTIHKAKGLQAPVIILIDTGYKEKSAKEDYYIDTLSCKIGLSLGNLKNLNYFILEEKENLHNKAQNERLLYVALTRAEEKLLIGVSEQETQGTIEKSLRKSGCYPAQKADISELFETTNFDYKDPQSFLFQTAQTLTKDSSFDWSEVLPRWSKRKEDFLTYQQKEILEPSHAYQDEKSAQQALDIGILVHKVLNIYFTTGLFDLPSAAKLTGIEDSSSLLYGGQIIDAFAKSYILKNLKTLRFADSEIPFSMYEEGLLVNGVIDALFEDNKGTLFIVDFKTDKIDISELENHSLKYVPQMTLYKRAVEKMFKTDKVKTILAYLRLDRLYEI